MDNKDQQSDEERCRCGNEKLIAILGKCHCVGEDGNLQLDETVVRTDVRTERERLRKILDALCVHSSLNGAGS